MTRSALVTALLVVGIQFGWREFREGETEYIVQIDDQIIEALQRGEPITSNLPPELRNVTRIRIQYGTDPVPQPQLSYFGSTEGDPNEIRQVRNSENETQSYNEEVTTGQDWTQRNDSGSGARGIPQVPVDPRATQIGEYSNRPNGPLVARLPDQPFQGQNATNQGQNSIDLGPPLVAPGGNRNDQPIAGRGNEFPGRSPMQGHLGQQGQQGQIPSTTNPIPWVPSLIGGGHSQNDAPGPLVNNQGASNSGTPGINPIIDPYRGDPSGLTRGGHSDINSGIGYSNEGPWDPNRGNTDNISRQGNQNLPTQDLVPLLPGPAPRPRNDSRTVGNDRVNRGIDPNQGLAEGGVLNRGGFDGRSTPPLEEIERPRREDDSFGPPQRITETNLNNDPGEFGDPEELASNTNTNDKKDNELLTDEASTDGQGNAWLYTFFLLCLSMGGNVYLGWVARGSYLRYRELSERHRRTQYERISVSP